MATTSKVANLNSLFNNVYDMAKFVLEEEVLMPRLVTRKTATGMAPRILSAYNQVTVGTIGEGSAASFGTQVKTADGTITPVIATAAEQLTDELQATDPDGAANAVGIRLGRAMGRYIDEQIVDEFANFSASVGTAGSAQTVAHLAAAVAILNGARHTGPRYGVLHPFAYHDVATQNTGWTSNPIASYGGDIFNEVMRQYFTGSFIGVNWFLSNAIGTGTAVSQGVFGPDAIIYDVRTDYALEMERQPSTRSWDFHAVHRFGKGVNRQASGVKVIGDASTPS